MSYKFNPFTGTFDDSGSVSGGTVTSVALSDSTGLFNITGSPITTSGTLTLSSLQSHAANTFLATPNGSSGAPTFRNIVAADVPSLPYANQTLSNLGTVALNTSLLPASAGGVSLGNNSLYFFKAFARNYSSLNSSGVLQGQLYGDGLTTPSGATTGLNIINDPTTTINIGVFSQSQNIVGTGSLYLETGNQTGAGFNSGSINLKSGNNTIAGNLNATGTVTITTGNNAGTGVANSGPIVLKTGTVVGGTRGKITFQDGTEGTAGYVWTSADTTGKGSWLPSASAGANTALSNLITTSINQDLISDATPHNLGNPVNPWGNIVGGALLISNSGAARKGNILGTATTPQGVTNAFSMTNQDTQDIAIFSVNRTGLSNTGNVFVNTGNTDSTFNSGTIEEVTGNTVDGNSGDFIFVTGNSSGIGNTGSAQLGTGQSQGSGNSGDWVSYSGDAIGSGNSGVLQLTSGNVDSGTSGTATLATGTANTGSTGGLQVSTGSSSSTTGTSGNLGVATGDTNTGTSGSMVINTGSIGDSASTNATGNFNLSTGSNAGNGFSGDMTIQSGSVDGVGSANRSGVIYLFTGPMNDATSTGPTGEMQIATGNNSGLGDSGSISIRTGTVTSGARGIVTIDALVLGCPRLTADPTGTFVGGEVYFNTTTNKLKVRGATTWETITSV